MADAEEFREAMRRIRAGDQSAAAELVRKYEPIIRREVRLHLEDARLRRAFDSMDVAQSVLASLFLRTAAGEYDLDCPEQLVGLLIRMTRHKVASAARKEYRIRRDARRVDYNDEALQLAPTHELAPDDQMAELELLGLVRERLTDDERQIAALRADDCSWEEVAARMGGTPQARRMQLARGVKRAGNELGLTEIDD